MADVMDTVEEVRVVKVEPGDVIWIKADSVTMTRQFAEEIKERAKELWPNNEIVVGSHLDIAVVRPA